MFKIDLKQKKNKIKNKFYARKIISVVFFAVLFFVVSFVFAFTGPTQNPPGGNGVLQVDSNGNFGIVPSVTQITPAQGTFGRVFTITSSTNPGFSLFNTTAGRQYTWFANNSGLLYLFSNNATAGANIFSIDSSGNTTISGSLIFGSGAGIAAQYVSQGSFASNTSGGVFGFPSSLSIGYGLGSTPTTIGQTGVLSVNGNVGIGTTTPAYKLDVEGYVQAYGYYTGDIVFQYGEQNVWRMFEDETSLYTQSV
ncbi:MAG: hypothetical protein ACP5IC_02610, partial [Minisyncoccia bacterium]